MKKLKRSLLVAAAAVALSAGIASAQVSPGGVLGVRASGSAGYPPGATPIASIGTGTTGAVNGQLNSVAGKITYLCGFAVSILQGATSNNIVVNVTNGSGGVGSPTQDAVLTYQLTLPISTTTQFAQNYTPCLPAPAQNTVIAVTTTAAANASAVDVNVWGYLQ